jgi:hypothetical protein
MGNKEYDSNDHTKIPFSFHKNTAESKHLLAQYREAQGKVDSLLADKHLLKNVLKKLGLSPPSTAAKTFTKEEVSALPRILASSIQNTFEEELSGEFLDGMRMAESKTHLEEGYEALEFFDVLKVQNLAKLAPPSNTTCLIPHKLFVRTVKEGTGQTALSISHHRIKANYLVESLEDVSLAGSYKLADTSELDVTAMIPGVAHGMLGMKEGEIREIFIHPDLAYGLDSNFPSKHPIKVKIELVELKDPSSSEHFPSLKPIDATYKAPNISSCAEFISLQKHYARYCGFRVWSHYKKLAPLVRLNDVLSVLQNPTPFPALPQERTLLLKLEWFLYQKQL